MNKSLCVLNFVSVLDKRFNNGFLLTRLQETPPGLVSLLCGFHQKQDETAEQARKRFFFCQVFRTLHKYLSDFCPMISIRTFHAMLTGALLHPFLPLFCVYLKVMYDFNLPGGILYVVYVLDGAMEQRTYTHKFKC